MFHVRHARLLPPSTRAALLCRRWTALLRQEHLPAFGRELRHGYRRAWLAAGLGVQDRVGEPPVELRPAAVSGGRRVLVGAPLLAGRAGYADVEMVVVAAGRADLGEPGAVAPGLAAERPLDRRVDEDARHLRFL